MQQLDSDSSLKIEKVIQSIATEITSSANCANIVEAHLLGSITTGEINHSVGTSDLDLLIVVDDNVDERMCSLLKSELRERFAQNHTLAQVPAGLRCRYAHQITNFSRYLALQGFHSGYSISIYQRDGVAKGLPGFASHAATLDEYLCIFAECLWTDIRYKAIPDLGADASYYGQAKSLLSYLNLLFISDGIFLPTHAQRVEHWGKANFEQNCEVFDVALKIKTGQSVCIKDPSIICQFTAHLRNLAKEKLMRYVANEVIDIDPALFWISAHQPISWNDRRKLMRQLCVGLVELLDIVEARGKRVYTSVPPLSSNEWQELKNILALYPEHPISEVVEGIHSLRINNSSESRRDWGHIQVAPSERITFS